MHPALHLCQLGRHMSYNRQQLPPGCSSTCSCTQAQVLWMLLPHSASIVLSKLPVSVFLFWLCMQLPRGTTPSTTPPWCQPTSRQELHRVLSAVRHLWTAVLLLAFCVCCVTPCTVWCELSTLWFSTSPVDVMAGPLIRGCAAPGRKTLGHTTPCANRPVLRMFLWLQLTPMG
jgi:hypothetical protein